MDIRIGVVNTAKELARELPENTDGAALKADVEAAVGEGSVLWLTDATGRTGGVPADKVAYVDIDPGDGTKPFGFS